VPENFSIEKEQRAKRLFVRRHRDVSLIRQMCEKPFDLALPKFPWMPHSVKPDEAPRPVYVGLLGTEAVVQVSDSLAQACE